jgi:high-affinity iron transporter
MQKGGRDRWVQWLAVRAVAMMFAAALIVTRPAGATAAQEDAARRILTMLEAAAGDYREGVRDGTVVRPVELEEARGFTDDARQRVEHLGFDAATGRSLGALFSDVSAAIDDKAPADTVAEKLSALRERLATATGVSVEAFPASPPSAARGQQFFAENCITCHGEQGDGKGPSAAQLQPPPANFTDATFMRGETPYDFFHVISLGKRNTAMPAWNGALSVQDRWDLVAYVWTLAPGSMRIAEGQGIYLTQCAACHGATANGHGTLTDVLIKPAPDLSRPQGLAQRTDVELFAATSDGIGGSPMPAFARSLSDDERWKAVAFLRALSLGGPLPAGGSAGRSGGPDGKRFGGLLRLLAREYAAGWSGDQLTNTLEYEEARALAEQVTRSADAVARGLEANAPEVASRLRGGVAAVVSQVRERAPVARVAVAVDDLAALVESHAAQPGTAAGAPSDNESALAESARLVDAALAAYGRGDAAAAGLVSDAYMEFEPLEKRLGATAPSLKTTVEDHFMQLRQTLRAPGNATAARAAADTIRIDFTQVRAALQPHTSPYALFAESATIILREGFEMVLVIGALLAYVVKTGNIGMRRPIYVGTTIGVIASLATAVVMGELLRLHPGSSDMLEGITMLLAAVVLFWVSYWLISKAEADKWQRYIRGKVENALTGGRSVALAGAAFLAVYREGFETVLFYQALYASAATQALTVTAGFIAGVLLLACVYVAFRRFQVQIPIRQFFFVTGMLLYAMAAVFAGQGMHELQDTGLIPVTSISWVPTIPLLGIFPSLESLGVQMVFLGLLAYATVVTWRRRRRSSATVSDNGEVAAELRVLGNIIDAMRQELGQLRTGAAPGGASAIEEQVTGVLLQVERLAGQISGVPRNRLSGEGGARNRH